MPRRSLLTPAERIGPFAFPTTDADLIRHYTFSEPDLEDGLDRRFYELCVLSELKNLLRSGDIWVQARASLATSRTTCCRHRVSRRNAISGN